MAFGEKLKTLAAIGKDLDASLVNFAKTGDDRLTTALLSVKVESVVDKWGNAKALNGELRAMGDYAASNYRKNGEFKKVTSIFKKYVLKINDAFEKKKNILEERPELITLIEKVKTEILDAEKLVDDDLKNEDSDDEVIVAHMHVKLPKMEIPKFAGDIRKWRNFYDMFGKLVHEKTQLSDIEKFTFLRTYLEGEPLRLISHFEVTAATYAVAWDTLISRYNNVRWLVDAEIDYLIEGRVTTIRELHDNTREAIYNLIALGVKTESWDPILVRVIMKKLDSKSINAFEDTLEDTKKTPKLETLLKFLEKRFQRLDQVKLMTGKNDEEKKESGEGKKGIKSVNVNAAMSAMNCFMCKGDHPLYKCPKFLTSSQRERFNFAKEKALCYNCLSHDKQKECKSRYRCKKCNKNHHNLLHFEKREEVKSNAVTSSKNLLPTAMVGAEGQNGVKQSLRVLIDSGSQASFISTETATLLQSAMKKIKVDITGVGVVSAIRANQAAQVKLTSRVDETFGLTIDAIVLPKLTKVLPLLESTCKTPKWDTAPWPLADAGNKKEKIDMILGADCFVDIMEPGLLKSRDGLLAQRTVFGWVVQGQQRDDSPRISINHLSCNLRVSSNVLSTTENVVDNLQCLWELPAEPASADIGFQFKCKRSADGKFEVELPLKSSDLEFGDNRKHALARYFSMERKLAVSPKLKADYDAFMKEYLDLGHMELTTKYEPREYFIPHHPIIREASLTTKLRVVFDATAPSDNGVSLNDALHTGPLLLSDLWKILVRFRWHKVVFVADISKMYRCIWVHKDHQKYQKVFYRFDQKEAVQEYKLKTLTYGTKSAPSLAIACLKEIATENKVEFPESCERIEDDFFMDDLMSGAETVEAARERVVEISALLDNYGFPLKKWASNMPAALEDVPKMDRVDNLLEIQEGEEPTIKTLGIGWNFQRDVFKISVSLAFPEKMTKRTLLSFAAKIFDPLGWLAPVTVRAKLLIQELWRENIGWDEPVSQKIYEAFLKLRMDLNKLKDVEIPRGYEAEADDFQLIGMCDASGRAYGAAMYVKAGKNVKLIASKSRVSPLKVELTLPRLELMGAVLLAELFSAVKSALKKEPTQSFMFTDSEIVLGWLRNPALSYKVFVGHRVKKIVEVTGREMWRHVRSEENAADILSRGCSAEKFLRDRMWFNGPEWAAKDISEFPNRDVTSVNLNHVFLAEVEEEILCFNIAVEAEVLSIIDRESSWPSLLRVIAFCLRLHYPQSTAYLRIPEFERAERAVVRMLQKSTIEDYHLLVKGKPMKSAQLLALNPFLDDQQIMRVGGRLKNSTLSFAEKHPMILPKSHNVVSALIRHAHEMTCHGGNKAVEGWLRSRFWILSARKAVRVELHKCIRCFRFRAQPLRQQMGNLPAPRVTPSHAFQNQTGMDFAGPISIRVNSLRRVISVKGYICLFVCLSTKAIHLELVSDLTTKAFLAALKRFFARRGYCKKLLSDNAKTFICANTQLQAEREKVRKFFDHTIHEELYNVRVEFEFIPPYSPNFGGLHEAGIKSTKYHLKRIVGDKLLTFEELYTILVQVEAVLNSRPLCPMSNDVDDMEFLTPGHFLIGRALFALPEAELDEAQMTRLDRFKRCQIMLQQFWRRWQGEYLSRMQQRPRWYKVEPNLRVGELVLIHEAFLPPTHWKTARVSKVHTGGDGLVRVVDLFDGKKNFPRNVRQLSRLPVDTASGFDLSEAQGNKNVSQPVDDVSSKQKKGKKKKLDSAQTSGTAGRDQITLAPRRSSRIRGKLLPTVLMTLCCLIFLGVSNSEARIKNVPITSDGLFVHHSKTVIPTKGKFSIIYESDFFLSKVRENLENNTIWFKTMCRRLPNPKTYEACKNYARELEENLTGFIESGERMVMRSKRSRGIFGHILYTIRIFLFGDTDLEELEKKEEAHYHKVGEILGEVVINNLKEKEKLVLRDRAVQREIEDLDRQINEKTNEVYVHVYLNQAFATIWRAMETAKRVLESIPNQAPGVEKTMREHLEKALQNSSIITVEQLNHLSSWEMIETEPVTYRQTLPWLEKGVFEEIEIISIPNLKNRTRAVIQNQKVLVSTAERLFIVNKEWKRRVITDEIEVIMEPVIINKVTNESPCEIRKIILGDRCELMLQSVGTEKMDEWVALSRGDFIYISENFTDYNIKCKNEPSSNLEFPIGIITADECQIESSHFILQTNAHVVKSGHGTNYHIPLQFFETNATFMPNSSIVMTTLKPLDLDMSDDTNVIEKIKDSFKIIPDSFKTIPFFFWILFLVIIILGIIAYGIIKFRSKTTGPMFADLAK